MSDTTHRPPTELIEMFERREADVRSEPSLSPTTRRRIRIRRGAMAAVVVAAAAVVAIAGSKALPLLSEPTPANTPSPAPPPTAQLHPTVVGSTDLFRWRVLAGVDADRRVTTELQTASLAGGDWSSVADRDFTAGNASFSQTYLPAGQFLDAPTTTLAWGVLPDGAKQVTFVPSEGCRQITVGPDDVVATSNAGPSIWATSIRCAGPATFSARAADGAEVASNAYLQPSPSDQWALTSTIQDGRGWFLHRIVEVPTGLAYGDAGIPNDLQGALRGRDLGDAALTWKTIPGRTDTPFVYGLARTDVERVVAILDDGTVVEVQPTILPGDPFQVFWFHPTDGPIVQLVAVGAGCEVLANDAFDAGTPPDVPASICHGPTG